jgi:hypothetical protein
MLQRAWLNLRADPDDTDEKYSCSGWKLYHDSSLVQPAVWLFLPFKYFGNILFTNERIKWKQLYGE